MDFSDIINKIDEFYRTADEKTLAKVNDAFSVELDGDISIEEYLSGFSNEYFYTQETDPVQDVKVRSSKAGSRASSVRYSK